MKLLAPLAAVALWLVAAPLAAQAPHALPPQIVAVIGLPGIGAGGAGAHQFLNVTVAMSGLPWTITGCVSATPGPCYRTTTITLDEPMRRELVQRIQAIHAMPRCEPQGFAPNDPEFTLTTPAATYRGHLPRDRDQIATRTAGVCAAETALAWWLAERFPIPGVTIPMG